MMAAALRRLLPETRMQMQCLKLLLSSAAAAVAAAAAAYRCTYGVSASATGSFIGMHALLHMTASTMCEPGPSSSFCSIEGSASGSSAAGAAAAVVSSSNGKGGSSSISHRLPGCKLCCRHLLHSMINAICANGQPVVWCLRWALPQNMLSNHVNALGCFGIRLTGYDVMQADTGCSSSWEGNGSAAGSICVSKG
jgi:hypothetical protein